MFDHPQTKRDVLTRSGVLLAMLGLGAASAAQAAPPAQSAIPLDFPGDGPIPWIKRIFHLYTGADGFTVVEPLPVTPPDGLQMAQLLRRTASRVTLGGTAAHAGFKPHVANQPTLLIPLFGSMIIELADGKSYEAMVGDLVIAEDCTGKGHISRTGAHGAFMIQIQLPKTGCLPSGSSDMANFFHD
ncbi:MAG: cupin domain-containing protein [Caulobacteraceae bacterium]